MTQPSYDVLFTERDLDTAIARSAREPLFLFKHSETCGMSHQALEEVRTVLGDPEWGTPVYLVSVQAARAVSDAMAHRFGVRHQSPQVFLVEDGEVRWHTSHLAITSDALRAAIDRFAPTP